MRGITSRSNERPSAAVHRHRVRLTRMPPHQIARVLAGSVALALSALVLVAWKNQLQQGVVVILASPVALLSVFAALLWWFAFRGHIPGSRRRMAIACIGGCLAGGIGGLAGFIGPLILTPEANQGPLLGIFVTGPLGFVAGVLIGAVYAQFVPPNSDQGLPDDREW